MYNGGSRNGRKSTTGLVWWRALPGWVWISVAGLGAAALLLHRSTLSAQREAYGSPSWAGTIENAAGSSLRGSKHVQAAEERHLYVVGTHHKTGTALMALILSLANTSDGILMGFFGGPAVEKAPFAWYYCDALYTDAWNLSHNSTENLPKLVDHKAFFGSNYKFVHVVRDPVELVVSAYLYHHGGPPKEQEVWLYEQHPLLNYENLLKDSSCKTEGKAQMSWYDLLHCLNAEEGVRAEAVFQTYFGAIPSMVGAVKTLHKQKGGMVLQQGLEDYSSDFDGAVARMLEFFDLPLHEVEKIVRVTGKYDLKRQPKSEVEANKHVTAGKRDRSELREIVTKFGETDEAFRDARKLLGYPKPQEARRLYPSRPTLVIGS